MPKEMTIEEIEITVKIFANTSRRAMETSFNDIQHYYIYGYLLS
ncbi:MAG: hypothetical protein ACFFG0_46080 [Candidatus Thorarchaeota archaeon]